MRSATLLLLTSVFLDPGAAAQGSDCANAADQAAMTRCAAEGYRAAAAELDETYRALEQRVGARGLAELRQAQRAWIVYRDAQCGFSTSGSRDGSAYPMLQALCLEQLTRARTALLKARLDCAEGDLSCGYP